VGHTNKTARTVAIRRGERINASALSARFTQIIANNRTGGWISAWIAALTASSEPLCMRSEATISTRSALALTRLRVSRETPVREWKFSRDVPSRLTGLAVFLAAEMVQFQVQSTVRALAAAAQERQP
jgi:hypothetical protein